MKADNACNIVKPPKVIKNKDELVWRVVKNLMKKAHKGDQIGFAIGRTHWILRKGKFSK